MFKTVSPAEALHAPVTRRASNAEETKASLAADCCTSRIAALEQTIAHLRHRCSRLAAEFIHFSKRASLESQRRSVMEKDAFIRELLPIVDNLERALASAPTRACHPVTAGVRLIHHQVVQLLKKHGLAMREDLGHPFDPRFHDAVATRFTPDKRENVVLEVRQRGWERGTQLFRAARVVVSTCRREPVQDGSQPDHRKES